MAEVRTDLDKFAAREVKVTVHIGNVLIPVTSVNITHAVNAIPSAEITFQLDTKSSAKPGSIAAGAVDMNIAQITKLNKVLQEKILNDWSIDPDVELNIVDGEGNEIKFRGFLGRPTTRIFNGEVNLSFTCTHPMIAVQAFTPNIYSSYHYYASDATKDSADATTALVSEESLKLLQETDSVSKKLKIILDALINVYTEDSLAKESIFTVPPVHGLNKIAYKYVNQFLEASEKWSVIVGLADDDFDATAINQMLINLFRSTDNFFQVIQAVTETFMFQWNTGLGGEFWMEPIQNLEPTNGRLIRVAVQQVSFDIAQEFRPPILQVLMDAPGSDLYLSGIQSSTQQGKAGLSVVDATETTQAAILANATGYTIITAFPKVKDIPDNAVGVYYHIFAPGWIPTEKVDRLTLIKLEEDAKDDSGQSAFDALPEATKAQLDNFNKQVSGRIPILEYLTEKTFQDIYLSGTSASLQIPLNLQIRPGRTYAVESVTSEHIFTGFLNSVTHSIAVNNSGGSHATSALIFTHVLAPGVALNPIKQVHIIDTDELVAPIREDLEQRPVDNIA